MAKLRACNEIASLGAKVMDAVQAQLLDDLEPGDLRPTEPGSRAQITALMEREVWKQIRPSGTAVIELPPSPAVCPVMPWTVEPALVLLKGKDWCKSVRTDSPKPNYEVIVLFASTAGEG